ncbi:MAG: wax ester/triacylglycerol synthase family O-acyltransferase [Halioglobus sp.]
MSKVNPLDLAMVALENSNRQFHMTAWMLFEKPARQRKTFVPRLLEVFRNSEVAPPFNQRLVWKGRTSAEWETVEPDMHYHVRHLAVGPPGTMQQFYDLVSFLNTPLLDRAYPLWDCYVIEGLEDDRFAVMIRVHHALMDGQGGLKRFRDAMSDDPADRSIRTVWQPQAEKPRKQRARVTQPQATKLLSRLSDLSSGAVDLATGMVRFGADSLKKGQGASGLTGVAAKTVFNTSTRSSARRYANCELPLDSIKAVAKASQSTVNDVAMTVIDHALHQYLREVGEAAGEPLSVLMPLSFRTEEHGSGGNQVSLDVVTLGDPGADLLQRLQQVHAAARAVKARTRQLPIALRQLYSVFIAGRATLLPDLSPLFNEVPVANLLISNMAGPQEQLYLGGARLVAFHGLPIVPPGVGLNVTFSSVNRDICLGVGALPEAMGNPFRLTELIQQAFAELEQEVLGPRAGAVAGKKAAGKKPASRSKASGRKQNSRKRAASPRRSARSE